MTSTLLELKQSSYPYRRKRTLGFYFPGDKLEEKISLLVPLFTVPNEKLRNYFLLGMRYLSEIFRTCKVRCQMLKMNFLHRTLGVTDISRYLLN